jgi:PAS domain S-box-containing protein
MNELSGVRAGDSADLFLEGGGECGALIAARDWSESLGAPASWPQSLKTATALLLRSPVPMVMLWGEDGIMLYNDAYSVFAGGRHPQLLGSKVREGWAEVAEFNDNVMRVGLAGRTLQYRDQELTLHRNGGPEQVWMNLDYSPVLDEAGNPAGVLAIVVETTERVKAERILKQNEQRLRFLDRLAGATRELSSSDDVMAVTARLLGEQLQASVCAYADMEPDEDAFTIRGDWAARGARSIVGTYRLEGFGETAVRVLHCGEPLITRDTLRELGPEEGAGLLSLGLQATVCMPHLKEGRLTALMAVHQTSPRDWTEDELKLIRETTERSWAHVERVRASAIMRGSEARLREVLDGMGESLAVLDRDYRIIDMNAEALRMDPRPREEIIGKSHFEAYGNAAPELGELYRKAMQERVPVALEHRYVWADGRESWIAMRANPIASGIAIFYRDITERVQRRVALQESEERLRLAAGAAQIGTWDLDLRTGTGRWDELAIRIGGTLEEGAEYSTESWGRLIHPDDRERVTRAFEESLKPHGAAYEVEFRGAVPAEDGGVRWLASHGAVISDSAGTPIRATGIVRDITKQKRAEETLRANERTLRSVVEQMPIGAIIARVPSGDLIVYNRASEQIMGHSMLGTTAEHYDTYGGLHEDGSSYAAEEYPMARAVLHGEVTIDEEMRYRRPDGQIIYISVNAAPIQGVEGAPELAVCTFTDITSRKQAEQHQRLLIDELSHRAKNLLAIVQGVAFQSFRGAGSAEEMRAAFDGRLGALAAAHDILTRQRWESAPITELIGATLAAVSTDDRRVRIDGPDLPLPPKTGVSLAMAVHELATNALKYGSLSTAHGKVLVSWTVADERLKLEWREQGGPLVETPSRRGFGTRMIERGLASELGGKVTIDFRPEGLVCRVDAPLPRVMS